ncbi:MAG: cobalt ECF transporter T component CbiQ [Desulfomonile tiedjei]|nr:cobalt ECF transporter T component CbiQ [Desulfomonile tiedjei]
MQIEEFAPGESFIHRMDPRVKITATVVFSIVVALHSSVNGELAALALALVLVLAARIGFGSVLRRLAVVNVFTVFLWFLLPFTARGEAIGTVGPLAVYGEGVDQALQITLKSNAIVLTVIALLGTSRIFVLVHALSHMGVPDKLVHLLFFCYRYLHVIHEEYGKLVKAMKVRGFIPRTDLHTYRSYAYLVGMLLVRSFDRSKRIVAAMKCRGFKDRFYILHHYDMRRSDYVLAACSFVAAAGLLVVR